MPNQPSKIYKRDLAVHPEYLNVYRQQINRLKNLDTENLFEIDFNVLADHLESGIVYDLQSQIDALRSNMITIYPQHGRILRNFKAESMDTHEDKIKYKHQIDKIAEIDDKALFSEQIGELYRVLASKRTSLLDDKIKQIVGHMMITYRNSEPKRQALREIRNFQPSNEDLRPVKTPDAYYEQQLRELQTLDPKKKFTDDIRGLYTSLRSKHTHMLQHEIDLTKQRIIDEYAASTTAQPSDPNQSGGYYRLYRIYKQKYLRLKKSNLDI